MNPDEDHPRRPPFQPMRQAPSPEADPLSPMALGTARAGANSWMQQHRDAATLTSGIQKKTVIDELLSRVRMDFGRYDDIVLLAQKRYERLVKYRRGMRELKQTSNVPGFTLRDELELDQKIDGSLFVWKLAHGILSDVWGLTGDECSLKKPPAEAEE